MLDAKEVAKYGELGWYLLPLKNGTKKPAINWRDGSSNDVNQIAQWETSHTNFGVNCGKSNIVVLDFDSYKGEVDFHLSDEELDTPYVITGGGGKHYYYKADESFVIKSSASKLAKDLDVRAVGAQAVLPPSIHPNGTPYKWGEGCSPFDKELKPVPQSVVDFLQNSTTKKSKKRADRKGSNVVASNTEQQLAVAALNVIPLPLDYDEWLGIYMALDNMFDEDTTLNLMYEWCEKWDEPFTKEDVDKIRTFRETSDYSVGTILFHAQKHGFDVGKERSNLERKNLKPFLFTNFTQNKNSDKVVSADTNDQTNQNKGDVAPPPLTVDCITKHQPSEGGIADLWLECFAKDARFNNENGKWYIWNGVHWAEDTLNVVYSSVDNLMNEMYKVLQDGIKAQRDKDAEEGKDKASPTVKMLIDSRNNCKRSDKKVRGVMANAASKITITTPMFNNSSWLNFPNGMFDTTTYEFIPSHKREDLHLFVQSFDYVPTDYTDLPAIEATCPRFMKYLKETIVKPIPEDYDGDENDWQWEHDYDSALMLLRILGYAFTHCKKLFHAMLWLAGEGGTGKSTLIDIITALFSNYAYSVDINKLGKNGDQQITDLPGKRLVVSTESKKGGTVDEPTIKQIADGSVVRYRALYKQEGRFTSQATMVFAMNDLPYISDTSGSVWRRLRMVEFCRKFKEGNPNTDNKLAQKIIDTELPGIFNLLMYHLQDVRTLNCIPESEVSRNTKRGYQDDVNPVMAFVKDCCHVDSDLKIQATDLYAAYVKYKKFTGGNPMKPRTFFMEMGRVLEQLGIKKMKMSTVHYTMKIKASANKAFKLEMEDQFVCGDDSGF